MTTPLKVVYMGMGGNRYLAEALANTIKELGMELVIISEWDADPNQPYVTYKKWTKETWWDDLAECDIAIAPQNPDAYSKSSVKLVQYMKAGLPVIASKMPAYVEIAENYPGSVYLCPGDEESYAWRFALQQLRDNEEKRYEMIERSEEVVEEHSPENVSKKWKSAIVQGVHKRTVPIIVANENDPVQMQWAQSWQDALARQWYNTLILPGNDLSIVPAGCPFYLFVEPRASYSGISTVYPHLNPAMLVCWQKRSHYLTELWDGFVGTPWVDIDPDGCVPKGHLYMPECADVKLTRIEVPTKYPIGFIGNYDNEWVDESGKTRWDYLRLIHGEFDGLIGRGFFGDAYGQMMAECSLLFDHQVGELGCRLFESLAVGRPVFTNVDKRKPREGFEYLSDIYPFVIEYEDMEGFKQAAKAGIDSLPVGHPDIRKKTREFIRRNHTFDIRLHKILTELHLVPPRHGGPLTLPSIPAAPPVGLELVDCAESAPMPKPEEKKPTVHVVIPSQNDAPVLNECLSALAKLKDVNLKVVVINTGRPNHYDFPGLEVKELTEETEERFTFTWAINTGLAEVLTNSEKDDYILILNSDVILYPGTLPKMIQALELGYDIVAPHSNCDLGWLHHDQMVLPDNAVLSPGMTMDFLAEHEEALSSYAETQAEKEGADAAPTQTKWVAFYCTLMRASFVKENGFLDEDMKLLFSDSDYCDRTGARCCWVKSAFAFHLGAWRRKEVEKEAPYDYHLQDGKDGITFWKKRLKKKRIAFYSGESWEKWNPDSLHTTGIGGSETCQVWIARLLAEMGHEVVCLSDCEGMSGIFDEVNYIPYTELEGYTNSPPDLFVSVRKPAALQERRGKVTMLWNHDTHYGAAVIPDHNIDRYIMLSNWHRSLWADWWMKDKIAPEKYVVIPDGIGLELFKDFGTREANDRYWDNAALNLMWAGSPDRGLDNLLGVIDIWSQRESTARPITLDIFYGFQNVDWCIEHGRTDLIEFKNRLLSKIAELNERENVQIEIKGRVSQRELAEEHSKKLIYVSPTMFTETFGITYLEAQAAGCVVITNPLAALAETLAGSGAILIPGDQTKRDNQELFYMAMNHMTNLFNWYPKHDQAIKNACKYDWRIVVKYWQNLIEEMT